MAQTPVVSLLPLVRLVSAAVCFWQNALDGRMNVVANLLPFGAIHSSATQGFGSEHILGMHPSTSLVADPSRRHELACQSTKGGTNDSYHLHDLPYPTIYFPYGRVRHSDYTLPDMFVNRCESNRTGACVMLDYYNMRDEAFEEFLNKQE